MSISTNNNIESNANPEQSTVLCTNTSKTSSFTATESVFAWISYIAGYLFCRLCPFSSSYLGGFLFILVLFILTAVILKIKGGKFSAVSIFAAISSIALSATLILSDNLFLCFLAYTYSLAAGCYFIYAVMGNSIEKGFSDLIIIDFFKVLFVLPFCSLAHLFKGLFPGKSKNCGKIILKIIIGVVGAVIPTLIVLLLLSYDESFSSILANIFDFEFDDVISHIMSLVWALPIGMYIFGLYVSSKEHKCSKAITAEGCRKTYKSIKVAPVVTVLAAVIPMLVIYVIFFVSQWKYYISGFTGVLPEEFSYAEYAREGFFQLCIVSVINFMVIVSVVLFMRRYNNSSNLVLKILSIVYSLFTLVLISTAIAKMVMYIDYYGLTPKRVYATWLMMVLAIIFIIIIVKQFVPKIKALIVSLIICVVMFAALSLTNIESFIAWYNVERYIDGSLETVDMEAMNELGVAAVPELVRLAEYLDEKNGTNIATVDRTEIEDDLYRYLANNLYRNAESMKGQDKGFLDFNVPYVKAQNALRKIGMLE